ncbi:MAG: hypothetical protein HFI03_07310 [Lachnospiraceae bacterium]|jgi:lipopolysaccharide biosynthesis protein|nr:hypothetical protein [Lachnospiraceae bacterium]
MGQRLAIFASYHREGMVDSYKLKVLEGIRPYVSGLVAVCNGTVNDAGYRKLCRIADEVIVRDNVGYDAGAYKDVLLQMRKDRQLEKYEEVILLNDTFFGFLYSLDEFFSEVHRKENIDFWGITKHPEGEDTAGNRYNEHIQSYFILIRRRMFQSEDFWGFWDGLQYPRSFQEAVANFEIAFSAYFKEKGYIGDAYCNLGKIGIEEKYNENPYMIYPYDLVCKARCPVLKVKSVYLEATDDIEGVFRAIGFLERHGLYDTDIIRQYMRGLCGSEDRKPYFDIQELEGFYNKYHKIYIYGNGKYGKRMKKYLKMQGIEVEKFVVSHKIAGMKEDVTALCDLEVRPDMGIIVALNEENTAQVIDGIMAVAKKEQIFMGKTKSLTAGTERGA